MPRFFIDRPVFAWVIALVLMLAGSLAVVNLPIMQYPAIAPPQVSISASYPGASARTVEDSVVQVIEQQLNGIDGLDYITSESSADGTASINLTFKQGTDPDIAQVQVQNKMQAAVPLLPAEVQQQGLRVSKPTRNFLVVLAFFSTDNSLSGDDLSNFVASSVQDQIARTPGVGDVQLFGAQFAMRIWLDPAKLAAYNVAVSDVLAAIRAQNVQVSAGQMGGLPAEPGQALTATVIGPTRLSQPEEFRDILLRVNPDGSRLRLGDVARVNLEAENFIRNVTYNGQPATAVAVRLAIGENALDTMNAINATLERLKPFFPPSVEVKYPVDTAPFVRTSILEVAKTLGEAIVLVFLVMYLFLQNFRATLIPTIAVPVVMLGTFGVLAAFGYSINTLTMFGMALSIGLLVDDAIVVVENVERVMHEEGLSPKEATRKSMGQITGALVGIALVLSAVFVPMAFFGGSTGVIYRQFSITIVSAMVLSVLVAMILTPALCATLLKPVAKGTHASRRGFFGWFNRGYDGANRGYLRTLSTLLSHNRVGLAIYAALLVALGLLFVRIPTAFLPDEDPGQLLAIVQTPPGATRERTEAALAQARDYFMNQEKAVVEDVLTVAGFSYAGIGQNMGLVFVKLKHWDERHGEGQGVRAIAARASAYFGTIRDAQIFAVVQPAVSELGNASGFDLQLQDRGGIGHEALLAARNQLIGMAAQNPMLAGVRPNGVEDAPQLKLNIDREKASALGIPITDINQTLSAAWGSAYVNDFIDKGRVKRVYVQGEASARMQADDLGKWHVRNRAGEMVPFSAFSSAGWVYGSQKLVRFNGVPAFNIQGQAAPGYSSGEAMEQMEALVAQLPAGVGLEWSGISFEERLAGAQAPALYAISLAVVFLCLAALYESWSIPVIVLLVVPLGILGAVIATLARGLSNDVFFQVGLLTTMGLAAKSAILIVEFAKDYYDKGASLIESVMQAARQRLRPILMTSLAFMFGVLPLAIASGAGSGAQNAVGTGVIGGMLASTFLAIFFVPLFFVLVLGGLHIRPDPHKARAPEVSEGAT
ncbi:MAG: efflux RND transporter permease subunit [Pseudomonadota bacterium]|nr:efflux RND transporter permease subunit [Pseudomonadota bacterium]